MTVILRQTVDGKTRVCNWTCHKAEQKSCRCICQGKYHGCSTKRSGKTPPKTVEETDTLLSNEAAAQTKMIQFLLPEKLASSVTDMKSLLGKRVKATRAFNGIEAGRLGTIYEHYHAGRGHEGVMVAWDPKPDANDLAKKYLTRDGFGRSSDFDELQWLELV